MPHIFPFRNQQDVASAQSPAGNQIEHMYSDIIEYQISQVQQIKEVLRKREALAVEIKRLLKRIQMHESFAPSKQEQHRYGQTNIPPL